MFCKNCGAPVEEGAKFCGNCGEPVPAEPEKIIEDVMGEPEKVIEEIPEEKPETAVETEETALEPVSAETEKTEEPAGPASSEPNLNATLWIVLCAVESILCCSFIPGIFGLIFAIIAAVRKKNGEYADAASSLKIAKIAFWIGVVLIVLGLVLTVLMTVLGATSLYSLGEYLVTEAEVPEAFHSADDLFAEIAKEFPGAAL